MKKNNRSKKVFQIKLSFRKHKKYIKRKKNKEKILKNWLKYILTFQKDSKVDNAKTYKHYLNRNLVAKPEFSETIKIIADKKDAFSLEKIPKKENGHLLIPSIFSINDNYSESLTFLKRLFSVLYYQSTTHIQLDYSQCNRIDIDASVCMDIILGEFISYFEKCRQKHQYVNIFEIKPINFENPNLIKILYSIGAFSNLKGFSISYPDIIPFKLTVGKINHPDARKKREIHITQMVKYVLTCMNKMNRTLTAEAEDDLFKVIGEVLINAEEHSTGDKRFATGYFQDSQENGQHIGIFNLVILNFGKSIYEKFSDPNCQNHQVVAKMKELSSNFTENGYFSDAEFEEQTLWTLYALQEGVTSEADWKRGNGSIRFIDSFFCLKGDNKKDNISYLSIISGNTKITFDGTYRLIDKAKGINNRVFKMMTFNDTGDIEQKPDKKYINFVKNYFPGTIISAKICIKEINSEKSNDEKSNYN